MVARNRRATLLVAFGSAFALAAVGALPEGSARAAEESFGGQVKKGQPQMGTVVVLSK